MQVLYNPGPENHKTYPEKTQIRPLLRDSYRFSTIQAQKTIKNTKKNHKKYPKKTWTLLVAVDAEGLRKGGRVETAKVADASRDGSCHVQAWGHRTTVNQP